jgi:hypothetical protein
MAEFLSAYFAELLTRGFFLVLGRVRGEFVWMGFQHFLLVCATHCRKLNVSGMGRSYVERATNRLRKKRPLKDQEFYRNQRRACSLLVANVEPKASKLLIDEQPQPSYHVVACLLEPGREEGREDPLT